MDWQSLCIYAEGSTKYCYLLKRRWTGSLCSTHDVFLKQDIIDFIPNGDIKMKMTIYDSLDKENKYMHPYTCFLTKNKTKCNLLLFNFVESSIHFGRTNSHL